jgi:hypothetical protein
LLGSLVKHILPLQQQASANPNAFVGLHAMLDAVDDYENGAALASKGLYALGSLVRGSREAVEAWVQHGGHLVLRRLVDRLPTVDSSGNLELVARKAVLLLSDLQSECATHLSDSLVCGATIPHLTRGEQRETWCGALGNVRSWVAERHDDEDYVHDDWIEAIDNMCFSEAE